MRLGQIPRPNGVLHSRHLGGIETDISDRDPDKLSDSSAPLAKPAADDLTPPDSGDAEARPDAAGSGPARSRSAVLAALLSFVWPGLGQLFLGRRRAAAVFAVPAILFALWAALQLSDGAAYFATSLLDDTYLVPLIVLVLAFGAWRVASVVHALLTGSRGRRPRIAETAVSGALVLTIVAMHGAFVAGAWAVYETSVQINNNDLFAEGSPTPTDSPTPTPYVSPRPVFTFPDETVAPTIPIAASSPTRPPNASRITFLLIGVDFMQGRAHSLTDSLMVISVDTKTRKVAMISVPRDTAAFQMYYGPWVPVTFKINTLLGAVDNGRWKSPDNGVTTLKKEIGFLVGIPIDYYAAIDIDGFTEMVDAAGGVDVVNRKAINDPPFLILPAGPVHLDGDTAMRYVRSRENGGSDYLRSSRQQDVLIALEHKLTSPDMLTALPTLLSLAGKYIATDFPLKTARNYVKVGQNLSSIQNCVLGPPYSYHPDSSLTGGSWTSRLNLALVANLSVQMFGQDSAYYGQIGVKATPCQS